MEPNIPIKYKGKSGLENITVDEQNEYKMLGEIIHQLRSNPQDIIGDKLFNRYITLSKSMIGGDSVFFAPYIPLFHVNGN